MGFTLSDVPIVFEDNNVLVINKPAGLLVHPTEHNPSAISVTKLFADKLVQSEPLRPGVIHRLDKDTSGVMILAKSRVALTDLQKQFKDRKVKKVYTALVWGHLKHHQARLELPIARSKRQPNKMKVQTSGKASISEYTVTREYPDYSLLGIRLFTGRTHQIRAQFEHLGHPVVGDSMYSKRRLPEGLDRQFLHSSVLGISLPNGEQKEFNVPLASDLQEFLDQQ